MHPAALDELLDTLKRRFMANMSRHSGPEWGLVEARLRANPDKLATISEMERTGGEPDVIGQVSGTDEVIFFDCSAESPAGRRSLCYDRAALAARKENKPRGSAMEMAEEMGLQVLTELDYRTLQAVCVVDTKTSSWISTPDGIRTLGGALFCDRRYDHVFVYHNGAESYFAARGFRGRIAV